MTADVPSQPPAEVQIDELLIAGLLEAQHPDLSGLEIEIIDAGWDNVMARIGPELAVRLPRRAIAERLLLAEQRWLPELAPKLPLPVPVPLRTGSPTESYPFVWSIQRWLPGRTANLSPPRSDQAPVLAEFLRAVHQPPPKEAPANPFRDQPLSSKRVDTELRLEDLVQSTSLVTPEILSAWNAGLEAPLDVARTWIAGDVHARNVLVNEGRLAAFIDWGDMCAGDRATDLASIWSLFDDPEARRQAIDAYEMSTATLARARGWAVFYGAILLHSGMKDNAQHAEMGRRILGRLAQGE